LRELEKFETNVLELCKDEKLKQKLKKHMEGMSKPIDAFQLKKIESKIEKANKKLL
jgi:hypothetical protein